MPEKSNVWFALTPRNFRFSNPSQLAVCSQKRSKLLASDSLCTRLDTPMLFVTWIAPSNRIASI